jgi:hypothetical protein
MALIVFEDSSAHLSRRRTRLRQGLRDSRGEPAIKESGLSMLNTNASSISGTKFEAMTCICDLGSSDGESRSRMTQARKSEVEEDSEKLVAKAFGRSWSRTAPKSSDEGVVAR